MKGPAISIRPARPQDARQIGAVHVDAWRSAYPGILSDRTLAGMSAAQQAAYYAIMIRREGGVFVAVEGDGGQIVGFGSVGRRGSSLVDGEIHTLYVLDDWRDIGVGRRLMMAGSLHLATAGCRSAFLWVLSDNPSRWFYERLGGRAVATGSTRVGGRTLPQTAYAWAPIEILLAAHQPE